jgi:hypothetical protein
MSYFASQIYMKKIYLRNILTGLAFILVLSSAIMSASGPGGGYSNAPSESNCTSCHGGSIITSSNSNLANIRLNGGFTGNGYIPDSTYTMELTFKQSGKSKFGFEVTCLDRNNSPIGTLTAPNSRVSKTTATISSQTREYIQHTMSGTTQISTDSTRWVFTWKAPATNVGKVTFHLVVMAANNNGTNDAGDIVYGKKFDILPSALIPVADASSLDSVTCTNYIVSLKGKGTASPTSYSWKLTGGSPSSSTSQDPTVVYSTAGTKLAILTVKNAKGVSQPDTLRINVSASPAASILNGASASICRNDSLQVNANAGANLTYQWQPNNKTLRSIYLSDTGNYRVKVTNTTNGCAATSNNFRLNWYDNPAISISKTAVSDSFCGGYSETLTATGTLIDSVHWYVNGVLSRRTKTASTVFSGNTSALITAVAKSATGCKSILSNQVRLIVSPKLLATDFVSSKTTSTIGLRWKKAPGTGAMTYSLNKVNYAPTNTDTTLQLSGLNPNTTYNITIRSAQARPCLNGDTTISIKTNSCSNLSYILDFNPRACKGAVMKATVKNLYNAKFSISYNNQPYTTDTVFFFTAIQSDSLYLNIIDSLSPTCAPLTESIAYHVDTLADPDTGSLIRFTANLCENAYLYTIKPVYTSYDFYKNNVLVNSGTSASFMFTGLATGDKLTAVGKINTCEKVYGPVSIIVNSKPASGYTFARNWKSYTFTANDNSHAQYQWYTGNTLLGTTNPLTVDFTTYNNSSVTVKMVAKSAANCIDSSSQTITVPNFSSVNSFNNPGFTLYPNPFGTQLTILVPETDCTIEVISSIGQVFYETRAGAGACHIQTTEWPSGIYHILIRDSQNGISTYKLVKS